MRQTKLFQALQQLPKTEHNRFKKYLGSPYFNVNETQTRLAHLIIQEIQSPTSKSWEKEQIWEALRLDTAYDDVRFRKYFSDLLKNLENFLALRQFEDHEESRRLFLLEAVEQRKLSVLYNSSLRVIRDHFQKSPFRNSDFYYGNFMLEKRFYDLAGFEHNRTAQSNWEEISRNLDYFYIAEKLWIFCNVLARKDLSSHEYKLDLMSEIVNYVENNQLQHIPPIAIYYQVLNLYRFPEEQQHYHQLKRLLDEYGMNFPKEEASDLYSLAQNYCIHQLNRGNTLFLTELFALYQSVLERRIIFRDDQLSPWDFRNIVVVGLRVGDYDWTLKFIEEYLQFLPSENRKMPGPLTWPRCTFTRKNTNGWSNSCGLWNMKTFPTTSTQKTCFCGYITTPTNGTPSIPSLKASEPTSTAIKTSRNGIRKRIKTSSGSPKN
ncbi:MAG: hypothetical protein IPK21_11080 [Haliscomenobacter sp.]|nr:hypothetical protein [Haliscomenobacter sp.]